MIWFFKPKTTISLIHHEYLVERSEEAKLIREEINNIFKEFNQGNFSNINRFERLVEQAFIIIEKNLELYSKESQRLENLEEVITRFFHSNIFGAVEDKVVQNAEKTFKKRLKDALHREVKHGKKPAKKYFETILQREKQLDSKSLKDARTLLKLHHDEEKTREQLYNLMMVLMRDEGILGRGVDRYEKKFSDVIDHFISVVAQEFKAVYDIEVDATLQEADLIHEIDAILEKDIPSEHANKLKNIRKKIDWFVRKDIKRIKKQAREFVKKKKSSNKEEQ